MVNTFFDNKKFVALTEANHEYTIIDEELLKYVPADTKLYSSSAIIAELFPKFPAISISRSIMKKKNPGIDNYTQFREMSIDEGAMAIRMHWNKLAKAAANKGTLCHSFIENFFKHGTFANELNTDTMEKIEQCQVELRQFQNFFSNFILKEELIPLEFELPIIDRDFFVTGTFDALFIRRDQLPKLENAAAAAPPPLEVVMIDWKFSKHDLTDKRSKMPASFQSPAKNMNNCPLSKYTIQQNIYRYILEKTKNKYNVVVKEMYLVACNAQNPNAIVTRVECLSDIFIEDCIVHARNNLASQPPPPSNDI